MAIYYLGENPCKNCEERWQKCHSVCEKYKTWKSGLYFGKHRHMSAMLKEIGFGVGKTDFGRGRIWKKQSERS